jgi:cyanate permease
MNDESPEGSFTLGEWVNSPADYFETDATTMESLMAHVNALHEFCKEKNLPMVLAVITGDDRTQYTFQASSVMPMGRCCGTILAAEGIIAMGVQSDDIGEFLEAVIDCEIERTALLTTPQLSIVPKVTKH